MPHLCVATQSPNKYVYNTIPKINKLTSGAAAAAAQPALILNKKIKQKPEKNVNKVRQAVKITKQKKIINKKILQRMRTRDLQFFSLLLLIIWN